MHCVVGGQKEAAGFLAFFPLVMTEVPILSFALLDPVTSADGAWSQEAELHDVRETSRWNFMMWEEPESRTS